MFVRRLVHTVCGVVLLGVLATSVADAIADTRRTTYFTFSRSVQMPGVVLPAGTYIFEVANPDADGDLIRVLSRDRSKVHLMTFTRFVYRPRSGNLKAVISLGESPAGTPPPVNVWYAQDEARGRELLY